MAENDPMNGNHIPENERVTEEERVDLGAEFAALGRKFMEKMRETLDSEEAKRIEGEFQKGMKRFTEEMEKGFQNIRDSEPVKSASERVSRAGEEVNKSEVVQGARRELIEALRSLSRSLDDLAQSAEERRAGDTEEKPVE